MIRYSESLNNNNISYMLNKKNSSPLVLAALGVVFGDIGTSPLYALRETLRGLSISPFHILGVLSLIFWSLIIIISIKYLIVVFQADNDGEGGILALLALLKQKKVKHQAVFYALATFGAGLIIGDGMLTPAISITSAVEGLEIYSTKFQHVILPLSCLILLLLFGLQYRGTEKIGKAFGPILFVWFVSIGSIGLLAVLKDPSVLKAVNPYYAVTFLYNNGFKGYILLGGVFLAITGGEALYTDIGHFGKNPIRISWFSLVLPALILNYFGQGAYLLSHPEALTNPFFLIAPNGCFIPLLILSTLATIIASQAVISASFSMAKQAVLLGLYPRLPIIQTSKEYKGQIYVPQVNFFLLIGSLIVLFTFKNSSNMTHAYGIAVNLDMLLVITMVAYIANKVWNWSWIRVILVFSVFFLIDLAFLGANSHKFLTGGWVPVLFAIVVSVVMFTWDKGMQYLKEHVYLQKENITKVVKQLRYKSLHQVPGITGIFITDPYDQSGGCFLNFLKSSLTVPENILIVNYEVENIPYVSEEERIECIPLDLKNGKIYRVILHYGFMDMISIPKALDLLNEKKELAFKLNVCSATYLVEIPNIVASHQKRTLTFHWQEKLFAFLIRNYSANLNIEFYKLPYARTVAIGSYWMI